MRYYVKGLQYLVNRFLLKRKYLTAKAELGIKLVFTIEDAVGRFIYKRGTYEPEITNLVKQLEFKNGDVIADIGANLGWYSILIDKIAPKGVKIYAFEPDTLNFALLKRNLRLNKTEKVIPINKAVSDRTGKATLYLYPSKNRGRHSLLPINNYQTLEVETITLDDFLAKEGVQQLKLLKIDTEGFEYFVLKGAENILPKTKWVILEYAPNYMVKGGINPAEFKKFLASFNFSVYKISSHLENIKIEELPEEGETINLFLENTFL